ncbi:MAG TPA: hypothetical protein VF881_03805 [Polyangiaceae bacterium]
MAHVQLHGEAADALDARAPSVPAETVRAWLAGAPLSREAHLISGLVMPAIVLAMDMWRVRAFTIDDAYISFRYARNLAHGLGLVYNPGERVEGYTNFLWTLLLAGGIRLGCDPELLSKILGSTFALASLGATYLLARRLRPFDNVPCVATWLLASTIVFSGHSMFGLETALFVFLVLAGLELLFREERSSGRGFPFSGLVFGLAGLTRPEAPMFLAIAMLCLGRRFFGGKNLVRGALFTLVLGSHVLWRHAYYGRWLPNTFSAKTGNFSGQVESGWGYVQNYFVHAGPLIWLSVLGLVWAVEARRRDVAPIALIAAAMLAYVVAVGGDWMPYFRFLAPFEPLCFLLVDLGARSVLDQRMPAARLAVVAFGFAMFTGRFDVMRGSQRWILRHEDRFWHMAAGGTAKWLNEHEPGEIAIGDIGYVGYATDYPLFDLLGLVDPVIGQLPGGYTRKIGRGFTERFFEKEPFYFLLISQDSSCRKPSVPISRVIFADPRFDPLYEVAGQVALDNDAAWCIYRKRPPGE